MRFSSIVIISHLALSACAYPGMKAGLLEEIRRRQEEEDPPEDDQFDSRELIGDLITLTDEELTPVGRSIKNIITRAGGGPDSTEGEDPISDVVWDGVPPEKDTPECEADVCCIWQYISNDLQQVFRGNSGRCTKLARGAVRLGFHVSCTFALTILKHD